MPSTIPFHECVLKIINGVIYLIALNDCHFYKNNTKYAADRCLNLESPVLFMEQLR